MAHETTHHGNSDNNPGNALKSSFWFVLILAGLFVGAINFVGAMGSTEEGHASEGHAAEHGAAVPAPNREATSNQTLEGETGVGKTIDSSEHQEGETHSGGH